MSTPLPGLPLAAGPAMEDLSRCVHCGMCLSACPTYLETGLEAEGPRGRIALMRALKEGALEMSPAIAGHLDSCIQCRACEDVCPSGVPYGRMMEAQRADMRASADDGWRLRLFDRVFFRWLLPYPGRIRALARVGAVAQRLGMLALVRRLGLAGRLSAFVPRVALRELAPEYPALGPRRGTAALLAGCVMPVTLGRVNLATARVLASDGWQVVVPAGQTCCGALHSHRGLADQARQLARQTIAAFEATNPDVIVINSAGCGAAMKEYDHLLADDPAWAGRAVNFSARVRDVAEVLAETGFRPSRRVTGRATYQESCHLGHAQRVKRQPRQLLQSVEGLEVVEMAEADLCCGSGGIYTVLHPVMSRALLERTLDHVEASGASIVTSSNPGCLMQLEAGVRQRGLSVEVRHVVELLDPAPDPD